MSLVLLVGESFSRRGQDYPLAGPSLRRLAVYSGIPYERLLVTTVRRNLMPGGSRPCRYPASSVRAHARFLTDSLTDTTDLGAIILLGRAVQRAMASAMGLQPSAGELGRIGTWRGVLVFQCPNPSSSCPWWDRLENQRLARVILGMVLG